MRYVKSICLFSWTAAILGLAAPGLLAQGVEVRTFTVRDGQGVRDLAQELLGDPNLWSEILKANQLSAPSEVQPGMKLIVPVGAIKRAIQEIDAARQAIQMATDVGARVFAAEGLTRAMASYDEAVQERGRGSWESSARLAADAAQLARQAHQECLEKRNTSADATVTDRSGTVQGKAAAEMIWNDLGLYSRLFENSRVRTLSDSYAEISFQDQSRIRLNENSQAVIQKMRVDLLNKERDSSVKLEKGAAFALLQSNQKKKKFSLNIPGVKTEINSKSFWVQKDEEATKIANYEGEIQVSAGDSMVVIAENHGSKISAGGGIGQSRELLRGTTLIAPANNAILAGGRITLTWAPVPQAVRYLLQVSADYSFKNIIINREDIDDDSFATEELKDGAYYWTVAAIDREGFPGPVSARGFFYIFSDTVNPFLYVNHPQEQDIFKTDSLHLTGETEASVQLFVDGKAASQSGGRFEVVRQLSEGINKIAVAARDAGGNETRILRTVIYAAPRAVRIEYDTAMPQPRPKQFLARGRTLDLKGSTVPLSSVTIQDESGAARGRTFADSAGRFQLSLYDLPGSMQLRVSVLTPAGYEKQDTLRVEVSGEAPEILLEGTIPAMAAGDTLRLTGRVVRAGTLSCNGAAVPLTAGRFSHALVLQPGLNTVRLTASDDLGHETVLQQEVTLDRTPPELIDYVLLKKTGPAGDVLEVKVRARDSSGLRRTVAIELRAGTAVTSGWLVYNGTAQAYEGAFKYPRGTLAALQVKMTSLILEDYFGNRSVLHPE
ncbi:MAG TPA: FecR domain-containing protein [bacterium]|nr:FecR domain-containing protein [bacterium]HPR87962.1 FecR domain-containing protein [bacterium]